MLYPAQTKEDLPMPATPPPPMLLDTTLREGVQRFGLYLDLAAKKTLLEGLLAAGLAEVELGCVGAPDLAELAAFAAPRAGGVRLSAWARLREDDLAAAAALPGLGVNLAAPVSEAHLAKRLGLTRRGLLERLRLVLGRARGLGLARVSVGLEDASRADPGFVLEVAAAAARAGACRVRLADTVGVLSPWETATWVARVREAVPGLEVGFHGHNDFGLATANALAALEAGAACVDVTLLGLGERAGLAAAEEVAAYLALRQGDARLRPDLLARLCRFLARAGGLPIPAHKPVAGDGAFASESGLHLHALAKDPALYEPFPPAAVGASRRWAVGNKCGRAAVAAALARLGLNAPAANLPALTRSVRDLSQRAGRPLTDAELRELAQPACAARH
jgi:homocitrate synthase NifV